MVSIRRMLPYSVRKQLWGDRKRWGLEVDAADPCWREWLETYERFYNATQRSGIGLYVNDAGYAVMKHVRLEGHKVLEIGAGNIRHSRWWQGRPREYVLTDVAQDMMGKATAHLDELGIRYGSSIVRRGESLPLDDDSVDTVVSFYSLEHVYPLAPFLAEVGRVLRPGGALVGAIPAEGGLAWGLGRWLTSRRWFKRNTDLDPDKIICWEHPNFSDEIIAELDHRFIRSRVEYWPLRIPLPDLNLVLKFVYRKPA